MFAKTASFPVASATLAGPMDRVAQDLNGDGLSDIVLTTHLYSDAGPGASQAWVYLSSDGGFTGPTIYSGQQSSADGPYVILADMDGDGVLDLVISTAAFVEVRRGLGNGVFGEAGLTSTPCQGGRIQALDVNGDGWLDIAEMVDCGPDLGGELLLLVNSADGGTLSPPFWSGEQTYGSQLAVQDLDGDGYRDLIYENVDGGLSWLQNSALGLDGGGYLWVPFGPYVSPNAAPPECLLAVTFDVPTGERNSLIISGETFPVYECGLWSSSFCGQPFGPWPITATTLAFADVNGDGIPDVLVAGVPSSDAGAAVVVQLDSHTVSAQVVNGGQPLTGDEPIRLIAAGQLNADAYADLFVFRQDGAWETWVNVCGVEASSP